MFVEILKPYKSIPQGLTFSLPDFCIITGKNGSGKSHLLEAMSNSSLARITADAKVISNVHHVGFNGLNPQVDEQSDNNQIVNNISNWWHQILNSKQSFKAYITQGVTRENAFNSVMHALGHPNTVRLIVERIIASTGKLFEDLTQDDVLEYASFSETGPGQLFFSQCALIFKAYHVRQTNNAFNEFLNQKAGFKKHPFLNEIDFLRRYGPPPWKIINEVLESANLSYRFNDPDMANRDLPFVLRLIDISTSVEISVNDLSSGEKVLMSLALAIYNTDAGGSKPEILILDEPDAPLHPQFSRLLIETLHEKVVKQAGVKVIFTTHSPSTVAIAPEDVIYEIDKNSKRPQAVSNAFAISTLTQGLDYLKISYENRRQVFVESKYDAGYYQGLHDALDRKHKFKHKPIFMPPHSGTSNCTDVISIVEVLRKSGSDLAFGLIDFDLKNNSKDSVVVLGDNKRYAIENYVLDPIFIALGLIKKDKNKFFDFGVLDKDVYPDAGRLTSDDCQKIVDSVLKKMDFDFSDMSVEILENNYQINYPKSFLLMNGHEYEKLLTRKFPQLNCIAKGKGDEALKLGIVRVMRDFPELISIDIAKTLVKVLD